MSTELGRLEVPEQTEDANGIDRVSHYAAIPGTENDPVRVTLCGITLSDRRHTGDAICVVCEDILTSLIARGLR